MKTTISKLDVVLIVTIIGGLIGVVVYNSIVYGTYSSPW